MSDQDDFIAFLAGVTIRNRGAKRAGPGVHLATFDVTIHLEDGAFYQAVQRGWLTGFPLLAANALRELATQLEAAPVIEENLCACEPALVWAQGCQCGGR